MSIIGREISTLKLRGTFPLIRPRRARVVNVGDADALLEIESLHRSLIIHTVTAPRLATLPTAAQIVDALTGPFVGAGDDFNLRASGGTSTLTPSAGVTIVGDPVVPDGLVYHFMYRLTSITPGSEAVTVYNMSCCTGGPLAVTPIVGAVAQYTAGTFPGGGIPDGSSIVVPIGAGSTTDASVISIDLANDTIDINAPGDYVFTAYIIHQAEQQPYDFDLVSTGSGTLSTQANSTVSALTLNTSVWQGHFLGAAAGDTLFLRYTNNSGLVSNVVIETPNQLGSSSIRIERVRSG